MESKSKFYILLSMLITVITIGITGYMYIENGSFVDSLYMTVITMSTVGFGEIHPLSETGKLFTIFLIIISLIIYAYAVTSLTEYITVENIFQNLKDKKMQNKINMLKNHTVVCGYGRNGKEAVAKLREYHMPCVVIERDEEMINKLDDENILYIRGDGTEDYILEKASLRTASNFITALPSDADNLFIVLSVRQFNQKLTIISRASNETSYKKLLIAGADKVIMPDKIGGIKMASLVVTPDLVEFIEKFTFSDETSTNLEGILVNNLPDEYINKTILDLDLRRRTGCLIIGFKTADHKYVINPDGNTKLTLNSSLIILGKPNQIEKLHEIL